MPGLHSVFPRVSLAVLVAALGFSVAAHAARGSAPEQLNVTEDAPPPTPGTLATDGDEVSSDEVQVDEMQIEERASGGAADPEDEIEQWPDGTAPATTKTAPNRTPVTDTLLGQPRPIGFPSPPLEETSTEENVNDGESPSDSAPPPPNESVDDGEPHSDSDWRSDPLRTILYFGGLATIGGALGLAGFGLATFAQPVSQVLGGTDARFLAPVLFFGALTSVLWAPVATISYVLALGGRHKWMQAAFVGLSYVVGLAAGYLAQSIACSGLSLICLIVPFGGLLLAGIAIPVVFVSAAAVPVVGAFGGDVLGSYFFPNEIPPSAPAVSPPQATTPTVRHAMSY